MNKSVDLRPGNSVGSVSRYRGRSVAICRRGASERRSRLILREIRCGASAHIPARRPTSTGSRPAMVSEDGWQKFLKTLEGWLDPSGTPTFGSSFVPSGSGRIVDERNDVVHVRIPGSLTQTQDHANTTYRVAAADVWIGGSPLKAYRLTQTTCVGRSTACQ